MGARGILARISGESTRGADDVELIVGNLKALLNTRLGDAVSAEGFGVVDLVDIIHDFPAAAQIMQRSIRATIAKYEPRLRNVSVRTVPSDDPLTLTFERAGAELLQLARQVPRQPGVGADDAVPTQRGDDRDAHPGSARLRPLPLRERVVGERSEPTG